LNQLRNRLVLIFLAATLVPLGVTLWITTSLLDRSLSFASTRELDELSKSLEITGRSLYQRSRESLKARARAGELAPRHYRLSQPANLPDAVSQFAASGAPEQFRLTGESGDQLEYLTRNNGEILVYAAPIGGLGMRRLAQQHASARALIDRSAARDLRRGFIYTFMLLAAITWIGSLTVLVYSAHRISRPIRQLTAGLSELASGNLEARLPSHRRDEIGTAMQAFNNMAGQLQQSRERLVYLTRLASWQTIARKMAHEVKNSLTPIRLTMEELVARRNDNDRRFLEQAAQIVVEEVGTLERRIRAFSEFAAEPTVRLAAVDINTLLEERVAFLKAAHPEVSYAVHLAPERPQALADEDLLKGVLTNLLENAAEAAGGGGTVLGRTFMTTDNVGIEVHDSGPGLSAHARGSLFEPTISFKKTGMGLGLSIARRSTLLSGGDILLVEGELGGAAFRVLLPAGS
jgi:Signal transduction histidine kinase involved in nitrogen fixation and metabolism regulation